MVFCLNKIKLLLALFRSKGVIFLSNAQNERRFMMSAKREHKALIIEEIKQKVSQSKSIAFVDYRGLNVEKDTAMRRAFKANGAEYKVYKNRLVLIALSQLGIKD